MSIEYAILGLLSLRPLSGYDIKKIFSGTAGFYYSDNNNQVYRTLVNLHKEGCLTREVIPQENLPARKVYGITPKGKDKLREWIHLLPQMPQLKNTFIIQLAWADSLNPEELDVLLSQYEDEVLMQCLLCRRQKELQNGNLIPESYLPISLARTKREAYLWSMIQENWEAYFDGELNWVRSIRRNLSAGLPE